MTDPVLTEVIRVALRLNALPIDTTAAMLIADIIDAAHDRGVFGSHVESGSDALDVMIEITDQLPGSTPIGEAIEIIRPRLAKVSGS